MTAVPAARRVALAVALASSVCLPVSAGTGEVADRPSPARVPATRAPRAGVERVVLERIAAFAGTGTAPLVGPERRELSNNVAPTADPHAAGFAVDRDIDAPGVTAGERQLLLDAGRRHGAIPGYHYGPRRTRRGDSWGLSGDRGHFEWDPVALGYEPVASIIAARLAGPPVPESEP